MNATIKSTFWSDVRLIELGKDHKHALLWLMTNSNRDLCGFTEVSPRHFTLETELPIHILNEACAGSGGNFMALTGNVYFIRRFLRHQFGCGGVLSPGNKVIKAAVKRANSMPADLADEFFSAYPELIAERLSTAPPHLAHPLPDTTPHAHHAPSIPHASTIHPPSPHEHPLIAEQSIAEKEQSRVEQEKEHYPAQTDTAQAPASLPLHHPATTSGHFPETTAHPVDSSISAGSASIAPGTTLLDPASIAALYPRRQAMREAISHISRHIADGIHPQAIADGTRAIAAAIQQLPSGHLNAYVPSAAKFFQNRRWEDDPQTWLRLAPTKGTHPGNHGAQPQKLSLGGRSATTIKI